MRICSFCGCRFQESVPSCPNCGSTNYEHICPNCGNSFEGSFCNDCGIRFDAPPKTCPNCGKVFYTNACPDCGYSTMQTRTQPVSNDGSSQYSQSSQGYTAPTYSGNDYTSSRRVAPDVTALLLSVMGLFTCMFPMSIVGMYLAIKEENKGNSNGRTKAAKYIGIVSILLFMFFFVVGIINGFND